MTHTYNHIHKHPQPPTIHTHTHPYTIKTRPVIPCCVDVPCMVNVWSPTLTQPHNSHHQFFLDPADVTDRIITVVKNFDKVEASKVTPTAKFSTDLGLDSLDAVEVVMAIEDEFAIEIPDVEADKISSVEDAVNYIASHPQAK